MKDVCKKVNDKKISITNAVNIMKYYVPIMRHQPLSSIDSTLPYRVENIDNQCIIIMQSLDLMECNVIA